MGEEGERDREETDLLFHLFMHLLVYSYMSPDHGLTHNLGISGQCSNQMSYPVRTSLNSYKLDSRLGGAIYLTQHQYWKTMDLIEFKNLEYQLEELLIKCR